MPRTYAAVVFTAFNRTIDNLPAGCWLPEAAYPWLALADTGWTVVSVSTDATRPVPCGVDRSDPAQRRFLDDAGIRRRLEATRRADFYDAGDFGVVVYAGGVGALRDLPHDAALARFTAEIATAGGAVAASGYGVAGLLDVTLPGERPLVAERRLTTTSAAEERILGADLPYGLAGELARRGARLSFGEPFTGHVVEDGGVLSGQNPASAPLLATRLVSAIAGLSSEGAIARS